LSQSRDKTISKEIKITTRPVVTIDSIKGDFNKLIVLNIIKYLNEVSEKALQHLIYWLKSEKNVQLKYEFISIGNLPVSKQLKEDINILLYLGLIETNPSTRKLRLTTNGLEFLDKNNLSSGEMEVILRGVEDLKPKIKPIEAEAELTSKNIRGRR